MWAPRALISRAMSRLAMTGTWSTSRPVFAGSSSTIRSEEHTSELQSPCNLVCRLLLEKKKCRRDKRVYLEVERQHHDKPAGRDQVLGQSAHYHKQLAHAYCRSIW